jgi:ATP-dependent DNA ligase
MRKESPMVPEPMLCKDNLDKFLQKCKPQDALWSYKLDGVRCLAVVEPSLGTVSYYSRNGKHFKNFDVFTPELLRLTCGWRRTIILDGEVCATDKKFNSVMSQVHRLHEVDPSIFRYHIFDALLEYGTYLPLHARLDNLRWLADKAWPVNQAWPPRIVGVLAHYPFSSDRGISLMAPAQMYTAIRQGYEGIVLKDASSPYVFGKSIHWCKLKESDTADCIVYGYEFGKGKYSKTVGKLLCWFGTVSVKVSGMTDAQRDEFLVCLPKMIEVKYQSVTPSGSLRHPRFVRVREDK